MQHLGTRLAFRPTSVSRLRSSCRRSKRVPHAPGFTLIELLAVLAMMAIIVAGASPTFVRLMRDRRVNRAAMQLVDYLRTARTLAIGKGQPILVRWTSTGFHPVIDTTAGTGGIEIDEPIVTTSAATTNCATTQWLTASTQMVNRFDIQSGQYGFTGIQLIDDLGNTPTLANFCFSATGKMYIQRNATGAFLPLLGVPAFAVYNLQNNPAMQNNINTRWVYALPNGAARMAM
jgi:type IV fimbrial biogenesis protein FimT